jgi:hypothetical protein
VSSPLPDFVTADDMGTPHQESVLVVQTWLFFDSTQRFAAAPLTIVHDDDVCFCKELRVSWLSRNQTLCLLDVITRKWVFIIIIYYL